jgi:hypothetical protein
VIYAILIFGAEGVFDRLPEDEQKAILAKHGELQQAMGAKGKLGPVVKLMKSEAAVSLRQASGPVIATDGPFAESKEQLLGLYLIECDTMEEAIEATKILPADAASYEIRPVEWNNWRDAEEHPG